MASTNDSRYTLSAHPFNYSLSPTTNLPTPLHDTPPPSPGYRHIARPPTPGGGPLNSHPTTPDDAAGFFPPTPDTHRQGKAQQSSPHLTTNAYHQHKQPEHVFRVPISPASATAPSSQTTTTTSSPEPLQRRPSTGVRRLLSISSLRSSFGSSRTSLSLPRRQSNDTTHTINTQASGYLYINGNGSNGNSLKRPSSPSVASSYSTYQPSAIASEAPAPRPQLRSRKSGSWFRRKSGLFMLNNSAPTTTTNDENTQEEEAAPTPPPADRRGSGMSGMLLKSVDESTHQQQQQLYRPETRESKRLKEDDFDYNHPCHIVQQVQQVQPSPSPPMLPEIGALGGGKLDGGELGWDEGFFAR
ncbi:hypothetical protein BAUCODRAFT_261301 [Baudoinia panamericana UAMH 10762]|uniref:Uncharacterized protein n=1 Tax=Baudoinia panamericana (strain UAMH 10762) TaxID=717646 RepID=M2N250_BAUPA|nr:uncharacterized protein BAUCODRAFT_261301 [Baudoinia panamericana UAMH 10762]EMC92755.1 hypothetical protein BAUCODRAFT_261301 [Baudoinia panamericana UAMH 10762]